MQASGTETMFFRHGWPIPQKWPVGVSRASLLELVGAAAWWIHRESGEQAIGDVVEAIFDVTRWWP
jgi:hypothetical protein